MKNSFDPYHKWLGIPPEEQPPNHYQLLGLRAFEGDPEVISNAADQRMAHLRTFQLGKHSVLSQKLLNEVAAAKLCLLHPEKRAAYDEELGQASSSAPSPLPPAPPLAPPLAPPAPPAPAPQRKGHAQKDALPTIVVAPDSPSPSLKTPRNQPFPGRAPTRLGASGAPAPAWKHPAVLWGSAASALVLLIVVIAAIGGSGGGSKVTSSHGTLSRGTPPHGVPPRSTALGELILVVPEPERSEVKVKLTGNGGKTFDPKAVTSASCPSHVVLELPPGQYDVVLSRVNFEDYHESVKVTADRKTRLSPSWQQARRDEGRGLVGEYFRDKQFADSAVTRTDPQINFHWDRDPPHADVPADEFSARWTGFIKAPCPGKWKLSIDCDDVMRLVLDGTIVCETRCDFAEAEVQLDDHPHALLVEFQEGPEWAHAVLCWELPGKFVRQVVPAEAFFPNATAAAAATVPESILRAVPPAPPEALVAGRAVDVLQWIDPVRDATSGNWWFDGNALVCGRRLRAENKRCILQPPGKLGEGAYRLLIEVERLVQDDSFAVRLPIASGHAYVSIDHDPGRGGKYTLAAGKTLVVGTGHHLSRAQRMTVVYRKHTGGIRVDVDDEPLIDWRGDTSALQPEATAPELDPARLSVGTYDSMFRIHRMTVEPGAAEPQSGIASRLAPHVNGGWVRLVNRRTKHCIGVRDGSTNPGATLRQFAPADGALDQQWRIESTSRPGLVRLKNRASGLCMTILKPENNQGFALHPFQEDDAGFLFSINELEAPWFKIVNEKSHLATAVWGGEMHEGQWVVQYQFLDYATDHYWAVEPVVERDDDSTALAALPAKPPAFCTFDSGSLDATSGEIRAGGGSKFSANTQRGELGKGVAGSGLSFPKSGYWKLGPAAGATTPEVDALAFWIKISPHISDQTVAAVLFSEADKRYRLVYSRGKLSFSAGSLGKERQITQVPFSSEGQWNHLAVVSDQPHRALRLFVNGAETATADDLGDDLPGPGFRVAMFGGTTISGGPPGADVGFAYDEVALYDRALSATEVRGLYEHGKAGRGLDALASKSPPPPPPVPIPSGELSFDLSELGFFDCRSDDHKQKMIQRFGGSAASERAVALALKWLAEYQLPDGEWSFDHAVARGGTSTGGGDQTRARNAATGLALLAFLGAGQTHQTGKYKSTVRNGLLYLSRSGSATKNGLSFREEQGRMYSHALATMALTEAAAMTKDRRLMEAAAQAVAYTLYAQHPDLGGWRYEPRSGSDTSVTGWQIASLRLYAESLARKQHETLRAPFPRPAYLLASKFLNRVQTDAGARYGYEGPGDGASTTAVGLACRIYLGEDVDYPALKRGIDFLDEKGPALDHLYYTYYGTQVMWHAGGARWQRWNARLRDSLVESQADDGVNAGSWYLPRDEYVEEGGRLLHTTLAALMLETYYRHTPMHYVAAGSN